VRWWRSRKNAQLQQPEEWSALWLARELASGRLPYLANGAAETDQPTVRTCTVRADHLTRGMRIPDANDQDRGIRVTDCHPVPDTRRQWIWVEFSNGYADIVQCSERFFVLC
jgi:hypothetical protein